MQPWPIGHILQPSAVTAPLGYENSPSPTLKQDLLISTGELEPAKATLAKGGPLRVSYTAEGRAVFTLDLELGGPVDGAGFERSM